MPKKIVNNFIIKRIDPVSVAKIYGGIGVLVGLVIGTIWGLIVLLFGTAIGAMAGKPGIGAGVGGLLGIGILIMVPLFYGVIGFVAGFLSALAYNFIASKVGGAEIELGH